MGVITTYDEMRDRLREQLKECEELAKEMFVNEDIWGYDHMREDYALDVYQAVKQARKTV